LAEINIKIFGAVVGTTSTIATQNYKLYNKNIAWV